MLFLSERGGLNFSILWIRERIFGRHSLGQGHSGLKEGVCLQRVKCLIFISILWGVMGCEPEHNGGAQVDLKQEALLEKVLESPGVIVFETVNNYVFRTHCTSCHNPRDKKDNVDLSSYEALAGERSTKRVIEPFQPEKSTIYSTLLIPTGNRHMPPLDKPQLTKNQKRLVYLWVRGGAKKDINSQPKPTVSLKEQLQPYFKDPELIDHKVVTKFLLKDKCMKCHSSNGEKPDEDAILYSANMTNYASLFNASAPTIEKGNPKGSSLFSAVAIKQTMPPEKEGYDLLDGLLIKLLRLWILNCAIEDKEKLGEEPDLIKNPKAPEKVRLCF